MVIILVRPLPNIIASRIIVAANESASVGAPDLCAAEADGIAPHHLRVVAADLAGGAAVGAVVVVRLLVDPQPHGIRARKVAGAPGEVLPVGPAGVHQPAVAGTRVGVALREGGQVVVPHYWPNAHLQ